VCNFGLHVIASGSHQFFPQFKLLLIAAVAYGIDDSVLTFEDAAGECTITKHGASLSLAGGCSLDATLTLEPDVSGAIDALEQKIHEELHDAICDQHEHANSEMVHTGVFSHATYNFCKFNCATDHFWDGSACSACAASSTCLPGEAMNTPVCDGSTTNCEPHLHSLHAIGNTQYPICNMQVYAICAICSRQYLQAVYVGGNACAWQNALRAGRERGRVVFMF
jgi:hypothetical protein